MSKFLDIVQQEATMDEGKLCVLCARKNIWDYSGIEKDTVLNLSEGKKIQLTENFTLKMLITLLQEALI